MWQIDDRDLENLLMHVVTCKPGFDEILKRISDRLSRSKDINDLLLWCVEFKPDIEYSSGALYSPDIEKDFYDKIRKLRAEVEAKINELSKDELEPFFDELRPGDVLAYLEKVRKVREETNAGVQTKDMGSGD